MDRIIEALESLLDSFNAESEEKANGVVNWLTDGANWIANLITTILDFFRSLGA